MEPSLASIVRYVPLGATLATSGQPSEAQLAALAQAGFEVIVNLALHDEAATVRALGMAYVHIPVQFAAPRLEDLAAFFAAMEQAGERKTLVHCMHNKRVPVFIALHRIVRLGWPAQDALREMRQVWEPDATWQAFIDRALEACATSHLPAVVYAREPALSVAEFRRVLVESGLGTTRPIDDEARLKEMLAGANLIVTARLQQPGHPLAGVARCLTDFSWCGYLAELAVSKSAQGLGIGRGLLEETRRQLGPRASLVLSSMPDAVGFYERMGMERIHEAFRYPREH
ncbi:GNAT family N-acetyltransferase [Piscinibacter sp. XHJ-5]|uniref:GNAT family N-acetyltransferase n=1 Tax=Piscinibacter sp. XHJ-5 TaxID=3037797 RepID=UPI002452E386|nr:GNAT family N-acetyltransferase [Piscinibacter sp. XHJ-5]